MLINRNLFNFVTVYLTTILVKIRLTGLGMLLWFRDIILEVTYFLSYRNIELILFIVILFLFLSSLSPSIKIGVVWPPQILNEIILESSLLSITGNIKRSFITDSVFSIKCDTST